MVRATALQKAEEQPPLAIGCDFLGPTAAQNTHATTAIKKVRSKLISRDKQLNYKASGKRRWSNRTLSILKPSPESPNCSMPFLWAGGSCSSSSLVSPWCCEALGALITPDISVGVPKPPTCFPCWGQPPPGGFPESSHRWYVGTKSPSGSGWSGPSPTGEKEICYFFL